MVFDVLWGIPSIVYGAFGFTLMLMIGMRASLLGGILTLALVELPILVRTMDEVMRLIPRELTEATYSMGATRLELTGILLRQTFPGLITAVLLAFGRGIGDAAAVLFTAGYTDNMPQSLSRPVASLPLAIFFQLSSPFQAVQERAYASALVLTVMVLVISLFTRFSLRMMGRTSSARRLTCHDQSQPTLPIQQLNVWYGERHTLKDISFRHSPPPYYGHCGSIRLRENNPAQEHEPADRAG